MGNKYISIGVLSCYTHVQKPLVKLLQLHCQECGFTENAVFLLERGLAYQSFHHYTVFEMFQIYPNASF